MVIGGVITMQQEFSGKVLAVLRFILVLLLVMGLGALAGILGDPDWTLPSPAHMDTQR